MTNILVFYFFELHDAVLLGPPNVLLCLITPQEVVYKHFGAAGAAGGGASDRGVSGGVEDNSRRRGMPMCHRPCSEARCNQEAAVYGIAACTAKLMRFVNRDIVGGFALSGTAQYLTISRTGPWGKSLEMVLSIFCAR